MRIIGQSPLVKGSLIITLPVMIGIVFGLVWGFLGVIVGIPIVILTVFMVLYFIWAPNDIFACFPKEGFAVVFIEGGSFYDMCIKYTGKSLSEKYDVVKGNTSQKGLFGMVFIPWWPLRRVYSYRQKWTKLSKDGISEKRDEELSQVLLMSYNYYLELINTETKNKVPINMGTVVEARIKNPYKALFIAKDWVRIMEALLFSRMRDFVNTKSFEEIVAKDLSEDLFTHSSETIKKMLEEYGIEISKISVVSVDPTDERYAQATRDSIVAEKRKEGAIVDAEAQSTVMAEKTVGMAMKAVSIVTGVSVEDLKKDKSFHQHYGSLFQSALDDANRLIAINAGAYYKLDAPVGSSGADTFASVIAANIASGNGLSNSPKKEEKTEKEEKKSSQEKYSQEKIDSLLEYAKKYGK